MLEIETVAISEYQWESTEEEIQDTLYEGSVGAESQYHWAKQQKLE